MSVYIWLPVLILGYFYPIPALMLFMLVVGGF